MPIRPLSGTLADETNKYSEWSWTSTGATETPGFTAGALPDLASSDIHGDSENDDLYQTLAMARRTNGSVSTEYLARAASWANYFSTDFVAGSGLDFIDDLTVRGGDHVYGWGLIDYYWYTGNSAYLDAAKVIGNLLLANNGSSFISYTDSQWVPGNISVAPRAIVGDQTPRKFGRHLMLMTELSAAGAGQAYTDLRNKLVAFAMQDQAYNSTVGMWLASQGPIVETLLHYWGPGGIGSVDRAADTMTEAQAITLAQAGVKYVSAFQPAIVIEALRRVIETATFPISWTQGSVTYGPYTAADLKLKVIQAAQFWYNYALHPGRQYTGEVFFLGFDGTNATGDLTDVYDVFYGSHGASPTAFFTDGRSYTHCGINMLMLGAQYIEETNSSDPRVENFRARAKLLWNRSSKAKRIEAFNGSGASGAIVFGNGTSTLGNDRLVLDTQIGRYINAQYDSSAPRYFNSNKGEWPYVDLLFGSAEPGVGSWTQITPAQSIIDLAPTFNNINDHQPPPYTPPAGQTTGNGGPDTLYANGGLAYDSTRDQVFAWGGGHENYGGNEPYVLNRPTSTWSRRRSPSPHTYALSGGVPINYIGLSDDRPEARHTYDSLVYMPNVDRILVPGSYGQWAGGGGNARVYWWDPNIDDWVRRDDNPYFNTGATHPIYARYYDGHVYILQPNGFYRYTPSLTGPDTWTPLDATVGIYLYQGCAAVDNFRGNFYFFPSSNTPNATTLTNGYRWSLPTGTRTAITTTGAPTVAGNPGLIYDSVRDRLVLFHQHEPSKLHYLNTETLEWTPVSPSGTLPTADSDTDNLPFTHTRFLYTNDGKYLLHVRPSYGVWEYSPTGSVAPPTFPPTFTFQYHGRVADQVREDLAPAGLTADGVLDHVFSLRLTAGEASVSVNSLRLDGQNEGSWRTANTHWPIGISQTFNTALQNASSGDVNPMQFDGGDRFFLYVADHVPAFYATTGVTLYITIGSATYTYTNDLSVVPLSVTPREKRFRRIRIA